MTVNRYVPRLVHDTLALTPYAWLCACDRCHAIARAHPDTVLVVKASNVRFEMPARGIDTVDTLAKLAGGPATYVREIWVRP
jgi:hypothetical protein